MSTVNLKPSNGVSFGARYSVVAQDVVDGSVVFDFGASYRLAAGVTITAADGTIANLTDFVVTTGNGTVTVADKDTIEVQTLTISGGPIVAAGAAGVDIVLAGAAAVSVALADGDEAADIATKIAGETYTGWTAVADGATVVFTATTAEAKVGAFTATFTDDALGDATGAFVETVPGTSSTSKLAIGQVISVVAQRARVV